LQLGLRFSQIARHVTVFAFIANSFSCLFFNVLTSRTLTALNQVLTLI